MAIYSYEGVVTAYVADDHGELIAASLWLRLGFVGLLVCVGAVAALVQGWPHALAAIPLMAAGGWLAAFSWRKAHAALVRLDAPGAEVAPANARRESTLGALVPR